MKKRIWLLFVCSAFVLAVCLGLRVGWAVWENHRLQVKFDPSQRFPDYREGVPMEEMDLTQYESLLGVAVTLSYRELSFPCSRDIPYFSQPSGEIVYTIPAGTELHWVPLGPPGETYPTYQKGWRWGKPFSAPGEGASQAYYYVPLEALETALEDLFAANPSLEESRLQMGLSRTEAKRQLLLRVDQVFYEEGVCLSPDLTTPLWGWDRTLLAVGVVLAATVAVLIRRCA